jgi:hypothetical protein
MRKILRSSNFKESDISEDIFKEEHNIVDSSYKDYRQMEKQIVNMDIKLD